MSSAGAFISKHEDALFPGPSSDWLRTIRHDGIPGRTGSRDLNSEMALVTVSLVRYFLLGFLAVALVGFSGTLTAQDFTVFGGFQHPGTITTVSSGVGVASSAARQAVGHQELRSLWSAAVSFLRRQWDWSTPSPTARTSLTATDMPFSTVRICGWNFLWNCLSPDSGRTRRAV